MNFHVYIIYSDDFDKIYIGMSGSLDKRIFAHNHLAKGWTRSFRPWRLIYAESFEEKSQALLREKELKSHQGREFIRTKILGR